MDKVCGNCKNYDNTVSYTEEGGYDGICNIKEEWVFDCETCDKYENK